MGENEGAWRETAGESVDCAAMSPHNTPKWRNKKISFFTTEVQSFASAQLHFKTQWPLEKLLCSAMAAQCDTLSGYLQQSDQGSNSERSTDSPLPGSEEDLSGPHPLPDPEWTEERFRVDRKKLEVMVLGKRKNKTSK